MGTPTPEPPVEGDPCAHCAGILWPAGGAPQFIHVEFKDLIMCPLSPVSPPNAIWVLEQSPIFACTWVYDGTLFRVVVESGAGQTEVGCIGVGAAAGWTFFQGSRGACESEFNNIIVTCGGGFGSRMGTSTITWS